jgi:hypothetical protein
MAESAKLNNFCSAFQELAFQVPNQFDDSFESEDLDNLLDHEIVFLLLCNSSQFGAPVFNSLLTTGQLKTYLDIRSNVVKTMKAIRIDYLNPVLEYKIGEFNLLRKALQTLPVNSTEANTLHWYFELLIKEGLQATAFRQTKLSESPDIECYTRSTGKRLMSFKPEELSVAPRKSQECTYWTQLNKFINVLHDYKSNDLLLYLFLSNSGHTIFADGKMELPVITMVCLLTTNEQAYITSALGFPSDYQFEANLSDSTLNEIQKRSPSRFCSAPSYGDKHYTSIPDLNPLDWIDTSENVIKTLLKSHYPNIDSPEGQPRERETDNLTDDSTTTDLKSAESQSEDETVVSTTTVSKSPDRQRKLSIVRPSPHSASEPSGNPKLSFLTPEEQFLIKKKQQRDQAKQQTKPTDGKSASPASNPHPEDVATTTERLQTDKHRKLTFIISGDACSTILRQLTARFGNSITCGSIRWKQLVRDSNHHKRFNVQTTIAKQIVRAELLPNDVLLSLCPSIDSIRYMVTVTKDKRIVLFNRVHHYSWNDWS